MALESFELEDAKESSPFIPSSDADSPLSDTDSQSNDDPKFQIDVGFVAWLQCASSFCLSMGTWGVGNSFGSSIPPPSTYLFAELTQNSGVFQTYYANTFPDISPSTISWIGSIQLSVLVALGTIVGPLYDYGYLRSLVLTGCTLSVMGMLLTSFSTQYWQLLVSQGVLVGIGNGCLFIPSFAVLPMYFEKKRAWATGIAQSGSALGIHRVFYPI